MHWPARRRSIRCGTRADRAATATRGRTSPRADHPAEHQGDHHQPAIRGDVAQSVVSDLCQHRVHHHQQPQGDRQRDAVDLDRTEHRPGRGSVGRMARPATIANPIHNGQPVQSGQSHGCHQQHGCASEPPHTPSNHPVQQHFSDPIRTPRCRPAWYGPPSVPDPGPSPHLVLGGEAARRTDLRGSEQTRFGQPGDLGMNHGARRHLHAEVVDGAALPRVLQQHEFQRRICDREILRSPA